MVYDATANMLNDAVWTPSFWLPTVESMIRALDSNSFMMDCDIGEQFLNYPLHRDVWPYTGLDLGPILSEKDLEEGKARWYHWVRMLMGFKPSPYIAVKMTLIAEEVIRGDRHDEENPFQWTTTRTNLPGSDDYDPRKSWISKIRKDGRVAADLFTFVDDERVTGPDEDVTWKAGHRLGYIQSYLGIQNAVRKLREATQTAGSWVGSVVHILPEYGVCVLTSPEKWNKLRNILRKWLDKIDSGEEELDHKELLSDRGFLVYVTRTYPAMIPYLKGFHLTIENWRDGRDSEGWKVQKRSLGTTEAEDFDDADLEATLDHKLVEDLGDVTHHHAPPDGVTTAVPRFRDDLLALMRLSNFELPPLRLVRGKVVFTAMYGFGDASGKGFGATVGDGTSDVRYRMGIWGKDAEDESSNYRELRNLVETVEEEAKKGNLANTEFFLFTDNSTAESAFYRSNSSSKLLHELILRLRLLEIEQSIIIHVIHVSGKRMIAQGTDGCSRGARLEGVMAGENMLSFVPIAKSATTRHPPLLDWVRSWTNKSLTPLSVDEWFDHGHGIIGGQLDAHGIWIPMHEKRRQMHLWDPPPALADVALEELLKARHKRTDTFHVILVPRLMLPRWRHRGSSEEPHSWWKWQGNCAKCCMRVVGMEGIFCSNFSTSRDGWIPCLQAWHPECYTCLGQGKFPMEELFDEEGNIWHTQQARLKRLNQGVKGAHLVVPFQCEVCWMRLLENRDPTPVDAPYVMCIRRANLDAIAGRAEKTITSHVSRMARVIRNCETLNKTPSYQMRGPFPEYDCVGMGTAVDMLYASLVSRGRIKEHVQFDTLRQMRSTATISYQSSSVGMQEVASFTRGTGRVRSTKCPTQSIWFADFLRGCEYRMGSESRGNKPLTMRAIIEILHRLRVRAEEEAESNPRLSNYYYRVGAMIAVLTAGSLRGNEGFFLSLAGLRQHLPLGRDGVIPQDYNLHHLFSEEEASRLPHVVLSLLGDFKGETGSDYHLLIVANVTTSGINVRWWVEKLVAVCEAEGRVNGAAFAGPDGKMESSLDYDATFREVAKEVQEGTDYIPSDLDVDTWLGLSRTPRKSAETRAKQAGVPTSIQDAMNRWSTVEASKGKRTRWKATRDTYTTAVGEMPNTWRYSYAL